MLAGLDAKGIVFAVALGAGSTIVLGLAIVAWRTDSGIAGLLVGGLAAAGALGAALVADALTGDALGAAGLVADGLGVASVAWPSSMG